LFCNHGILTRVAGDHQNVLKILPPLITTHAQAEEFVAAIDDVLGELEHSLGLLWGVGSSLALPALRARR
jgi:acetylornithine/succinyldiaminopimelate/putrescine aminotransferase